MRPVNEQFATVDGVRLCYETFGSERDPAVLLVMGLGTQMIAWHADFCARIAERGFFVIRYDNRDVGRSTHLDHRPPPTTREILTRRHRNPAYTLGDMADDGMGLLDQLDVDAAHVVGASMGGVLAQIMAAWRPDRVRSLVSIMSNTGSLLSGPARDAPVSLFRREAPANEGGVHRASREGLRHHRLTGIRARRGRLATARGEGLRSGRDAHGHRPSAGGDPVLSNRVRSCAASRCRRSSSTERRTCSCARRAAAPPRARFRARACS
jgi:pimeloyl-ACP methyl ester carboxylesterase